MGFTLKASPEDFVVEEMPAPGIVNDEKGGAYTYFRLVKRGLTTEDAILRIARRLRRPRKLFGYAGTKDKEALTTQYCSLRGPIAAFSLERLSVEPVGSGKEPLSLGMLLGNRFIIRVRDADGQPRLLDAVPNYFDEQRFGSQGANLAIGKALLAGALKEAAGLAMAQSAAFAEEARAHLSTHANDWAGALRLVPKKVRLFWVHAVQSALFDELLDRAIRQESATVREIDIPPLGRLAVPESVPAGLSGAELPVFGFGFDLADVADLRIREAAAALLREHELSARSFVIRAMPELSAESGSRQAFVRPQELQVKAEGSDCLLSFSLPKGSYATAAVKAFFAR